MRILIRTAWAFLWILAAGALNLGVSMLGFPDAETVLLEFPPLRLTLAGAGAAAALMMLALMGCLWRWMLFPPAEKRSAGAMMNCIGFGLLPSLAIWKAFETYTALGKGIPVFKPLGEPEWITESGCFCPGRMEIVLAAAAFAGVVLWLILRKNELPGNGDLLLAVLCIWSAIRMVTGMFRADPLLSVSGVRLTSVLCGAVELTALIIWLVRRKEKSAGMTALNLLAVTGCTAVAVLQDVGAVTAGSEIADLTVRIGCAVLSGALVLLAGRDSRADSAEAKGKETPSSSPQWREGQSSL